MEFNAFFNLFRHYGCITESLAACPRLSMVLDYIICYVMETDHIQKIAKVGNQKLDLK